MAPMQSHSRGCSPSGAQSGTAALAALPLGLPATPHQRGGRDWGGEPTDSGCGPSGRHVLSEAEGLARLRGLYSVVNQRALDTQWGSLHVPQALLCTLFSPGLWTYDPLGS